MIADIFWVSKSKEQNHSTNDASKTVSSSVLASLCDNKLEEEEETIKRTFESSVLDNLFKNIDYIMQRVLNENIPVKENQNQQFTKTLNGEINQFRIKYLLLEYDFKELKEKFQKSQTQSENIKQQAKKNKQANCKQVQQLRNQLKEAKQTIKNLSEEKNNKIQQIKWERAQLNDAITPFLNQQNKLNTKQSGKLQPNFEDMLRSVKELCERLNNRIKEHELENKFVLQDFEKIISNFNEIKIEDFTYQQSGLNQASFFSKSINSLTKKQEEFKIPSYYKQIIELMKLVDQKNKRILQNWNDKLASVNKRSKQFQVNIKELEEILEQKKTQKETLQEKYQSDKIKLDAKITGLQKENQSHCKKIQYLQDSSKNLKDEIENLKEESKAKIQKFNKQLKQKQDQLENKKNQIIQFKKEIVLLKEEIQRLNGKVSQHQKTIKRLNDSITQLKQKNTKLQGQLETEKLRGSQYIKQLQDTKIQFKQRITKLQMSNKQINKQITTVEKKLVDSNHQLERQQRKSYELERIKNEMEQHIEELSKVPKFIRCYAQYFNGNILNYKKTQKIELFVNHIEAEMNEKIISTRLLYRDDRFNNNSFHNYVDGIRNIVLLVTHSNGKIIGGFSEAAYEKKNGNCDFRKGLILEFTNGKVFHTKRQKQEKGKTNKTISRPLSYDEFYIIWGNSDLKIKPPTPKAREIDLELHSYYGTANSCYEERGNANSSIEDLYGTKNRNLIYENFQMFEVIFQ